MFSVCAYSCFTFCDLLIEFKDLGKSRDKTVVKKKCIMEGWNGRMELLKLL